MGAKSVLWSNQPVTRRVDEARDSQVTSYPSPSGHQLLLLGNFFPSLSVFFSCFTLRPGAILLSHESLSCQDCNSLCSAQNLEAVVLFFLLRWKIAVSCFREAEIFFLPIYWGLNSEEKSEFSQFVSSSGLITGTNDLVT
jgi:hypothetical protein